MTRKLTLGEDSSDRKNIPLHSGCYAYFAAALAGVARHSKLGNDKHNPGEPLHHSRGKSADHADCVARHLMDIADMLAHKVVYKEEEKVALLTEANALAWRALALSQELHEKFGAPLAPGAKLPKDENAGWDIGSDYPKPDGSSRWRNTVWTPSMQNPEICLACGGEWGSHMASRKGAERCHITPYKYKPYKE
jgi:hypothetical protein